MQEEILSLLCKLWKTEAKGFFFLVCLVAVVCQSCKGTVLSFVAYFLSVQKYYTSALWLTWQYVSEYIYLFWHSGLLGK